MSAKTSVEGLLLSSQGYAAPKLCSAVISAKPARCHRYAPRHRSQRRARIFLWCSQWCHWCVTTSSAGTSSVEHERPIMANRYKCRKSLDTKRTEAAAILRHRRGRDVIASTCIALLDHAQRHLMNGPSHAREILGNLGKQQGQIPRCTTAKLRDEFEKLVEILGGLLVRVSGWLERDTRYHISQGAGNVEKLLNLGDCQRAAVHAGKYLRGQHREPPCLPSSVVRGP